MPIYEYKCKKCENEFSKLVFSSTAEVKCPKCESEEVEKLISAVSSFSPGSDSSGGGCSSPSGFT
ncbi:FmdB family zinc ribbon protein [Limisalsivibrio acetivorans]|uniref:FmdB family zinc ribbon protein n=1 Tax=Limisalsivibrio acetivorans TaxID=1304888 RepID=UPI0003B3AA6F|nr:zinc ribbon domain-containing protein [Limisalsivibrio acetivorans]